MSEWGKFSPRELRESGLLWEVNRLVLWPLGLALTVSYDPETDIYSDELFIQQIEPAETIVDGIESPDSDHPAIRYAAWASKRRVACVVGDARALLKRVTEETTTWPVDS